MGSSLVLTGGAATAKTLKESISLASHGFSVGDVIRWDYSTSSPSYVRAQADSAANAEVLGIVSAKVDTNTFELTYGGYIDLPQFAGISYPVLFLSGVCAGGLTHNPPSALGTVVKPVVTRHPTLNGFVLNNYLGTQIGGSSTIGIDEIQPVGTIMPFAGTSIPDTWLECNGATYSMSSYPELYSKLCYTTGDRAPIYGHVFTVTTSTVNYATGKSATDIANGIAAGVYLRYGAGGPGGVPYLIAKVLSITGSGNAITLTAQVVPIYDTTSKTFVVPNLILPTGNTINGIGNLNAGWGEDYVTEAVASTVSVTSFCVPNLRGRTIIGTNSSVYSLDEADDPEVIRSSIGLYPQGAHGGEEKHILTEGELPSHSHGLKAIAIQLASGTPTYNLISADNHGGNLSGTVGSYTGSDGLLPRTGATGSNVSHNNMPPYLAVRYIIKAKPYTRAAIIDGVDLPYSNLLVRSTDSNSLRSELLSGASGGDLVFYTNSGEASKTGTERMRISNSGTLGIGTSTPGASLDVNGTLKVGDFGGATNVMVKPRNTTPGAVGYVQPFYFASSGGITSNGIPAGTWFVYGQWVENTNSAYDNDPTNFMAKVWTVPPGKYLHIASDDQLWGTGTTDDGKGGKINLHWKMSNSAIETIKGAVSGWGGGWTAFVIPPTANPSATTVGSDTVTAMSGYVFGYAEYDTYGVRGGGNNTPLGSGYGYIQRLA